MYNELKYEYNAADILCSALFQLYTLLLQLFKKILMLKTNFNIIVNI